MQNRITVVVLILFACIAQTNSQEWQVIQNMPIPRFGMASTVNDSVIYLIGGLEDDPYVVPNQDSIARIVDIYNPHLNTWSSLPPINHSRYNANAFFYQGDLYVINGRNLLDSLVKSIEVFDAQSGQWYVINSNFVEARSEAGIALFSDTLYQVGGNVNIMPYNLISILLLPSFQPISIFSSFPQHRLLQGVTVRDPYIYIIGGIDLSPTNQVLRIHYKTLQLENAPSLNIARAGCAAVTLTDTIWTIGGFSSLNQSISDVEFLAQGDSIWLTGNNLLFEREGHSAVLLNDNLYIFGGWNRALNQPVPQVEVYYKNIPLGINSPNVDFPTTTANKIKVYPNPFNSSQMLKFFMPTSGNVNFKLYDLLGQFIGEIYNQRLGKGWQSIQWDISSTVKTSLPSGIYILQLERSFPNYLFMNNFIKIVYLK